MISEPENKSPILMSEGNQQFTRHQYARTEPCVFIDEAGETSEAFAHIFVCSATGAARRYGCAEAPN